MVYGQKPIFGLKLRGILKTRRMPVKKSKKSGSNGMETPAPQKGGLLNQVGDSLKENLKVTPGEVTDAIVQDAKLAVNYEIRRGFRNLISGFFKR